jgi:hypothetical protein
LSHPQGVPQANASEDPEDPNLAPVAFNPVLRRDFKPLFNSSACFTSAEQRRTRWFLSLQGDVGRPFRRLPWVAARGQSPGQGKRQCVLRPIRQPLWLPVPRPAGADPDGRGGSTASLLRDAYLRPGASWRDISVTLGRGRPITRLEIIKSYSSQDLNEEGRDHVQWLLVDMPPSTSSSEAAGSTGFLTMGLLYNILLCAGGVGDDSAATFGGETGAWDLLLGKRLRSYDLLVDYECFIHNDEELVESGHDAEGSAILYVRGGDVDATDWEREYTGFGFIHFDDDEVGWLPEILGDRPTIRPANVA